ncbi:MAG: DUF1249 domain-containing protein [Pseudomonadota bacterium]
MQTDSRIVPQTQVKPRSFAGLMSVYESNYLRLWMLVPGLDRLDGTVVSTGAADDLPLHCTVEERTRYTLTLRLTYLFDTPGSDGEMASIADPDLRLRIYFDGKLAEVMSMSAQHRHHILRDIAASHRETLDSRWRRNVLLNKWLEYLLDAGHRVAP